MLNFRQVVATNKLVYFQIYGYSNQKLIEALKRQTEKYSDIYTIDSTQKKKEDECMIQAFNREKDQFVNLKITKMNYADKRLNISTQNLLQDSLMRDQILQFLNSHLEKEQIVIDEIESGNELRSGDNMEYPSMYLIQEESQDIILDQLYYEDREQEQDVNLNRSVDKRDISLNVVITKERLKQFIEVDSLLLEGHNKIGVRIEESVMTEEHANVIGKELAKLSKKKELVMRFPRVDSDVSFKVWSVYIQVVKQFRSIEIELSLDTTSMQYMHRLGQLLCLNCSINLTAIRLTAQSQIPINFIQTLAHMPRLKHIALACDISQIQDLPQVMNAINSSPYIQSLSLTFNHLISSDTHLFQRIQYSHNNLHNLQNISSFTVQFEATPIVSVQAISNVFSAVRIFNNLQSLALRFASNLDLDGFDEMYEQLTDLSSSKLYNLKEFSLELLNINLQDDDAGDIGVLVSQFSNISTLKLSLSQNGITDKGLINLFDGISECKYLTNLILNLDDNQIHWNQQNGIHLLKHNTNIQHIHLNISSNHISQQTLQNVGVWISKHNNLKSLSLELNISCSSSINLIPLGKQIGNCTQLQRVCLSFQQSPQIHIDSIYDFSTQLRSCKDLEIFQFQKYQSNQFTHEEISSVLLDMKQFNTKIQQSKHHSSFYNNLL